MDDIRAGVFAAPPPRVTAANAAAMASLLGVSVDAHHSAEQRRLDESAARKTNWQRWGPYLSERQWGTVREDYSYNGAAWDNFTFDMAAMRAFRWGEDGLLGICDRECRMCFALALWNGKDSILKERLFGLTNSQGNHGEDVKESYFYLDATPTSSYMRAVYKYPFNAFPYEELVCENARRGRQEPEYELEDTGALDNYYDVQAEYAKAGPNDIYVRITATNFGSEPGTLHVIPTLWFRNTWSWAPGCNKPSIKARVCEDGSQMLVTQQETLKEFHLHACPNPQQRAGQTPVELLFTENDTNTRKLWNVTDCGPYTKEAFHEHIIRGNEKACNPCREGTKAGVHYVLRLLPGQSETLLLRIVAADEEHEQSGSGGCSGAAAVFERQIREADEFYSIVLHCSQLSRDEKMISRQAYAGLLWSKQFYHYSVRQWLHGDASFPPPPPERCAGRNADWAHLYNSDVISMPDKWEYPWYASWDLAFHMVAMCSVDPYFAKSQLILLLREWFMHPSGQIPAYEYNFGDVNPPVHAWAVWRVYLQTGRRDRVFLARCFHKLLLNFTWWVNRKDPRGKNLFAGGFLGLDNIGVFDRSRPLANGAFLEQADGTAWMGFFCSFMLAIACELAFHDIAYEDIASKFFEHFVAIIDAINRLGGTGLYDENDGFYYDQILMSNGVVTKIRCRSLVGLLPLIATHILDHETLARLPAFRRRMNWFLQHRSELGRHVASNERAPGECDYLLALVPLDRLKSVLGYMLSEDEFLSEYGIRSLSKSIGVSSCPLGHLVYTPGESDSEMFGSNSNWRGPIWFPTNYLLIMSLFVFHDFYGDAVTVPYRRRHCDDTSSPPEEEQATLKEVAVDLAVRLESLFIPVGGARPVTRDKPVFEHDDFRNLCLFYEYFHGDTGRGCGASHQTGWTALITNCIGIIAKARAECEARRQAELTGKTQACPCKAIPSWF
eukprot:TRINITY_DN1662_c0_g1_i10.p1 TRINITY_DN1662_c0_g1~~TRINITY_DN1662_c0_g1_i10.p1  ORF type:complete len:952 (-),score=186.03 TRINITY_DN1662_c0_g1_i10:586-3441(-)